MSAHVFVKEDGKRETRSSPWSAGTRGRGTIQACINRRYGVRLSESQNGFRAIRTPVLRELRLRSRHTTIEQEMIVETLRRGYRMAEVPSHEYPRRAGRSHIVLWRHGWSYLFSLLRLMI